MIDLQDIINYIEFTKETHLLYKDKEWKKNTSHILAPNDITQFHSNVISVDLIKYGIIHNIQTHNTNNNISFYNCVNHLLIDKYNSLSLEQQMLQCDLLMNYVCNQLFSDRKLEYGKYNWKIVNIVNDIKKYTINKYIIQIIVDIMDINLFIITKNLKGEEHIYLYTSLYDPFDVELNKFTIHVNPFRKNLLVYHSDNIYEPVSHTVSRNYFTIYDTIFQELYRNANLTVIKPEVIKKRNVTLTTIDEEVVWIGEENQYNITFLGPHKPVDLFDLYVEHYLLEKQI